jgi:predicted peroxiredoxin
MAKKMVVFCGSDEPEKAFPPFMLGLGAIAAGMEVMCFFTMSGLNIIKEGGAERIELPNAPMTLPEFVKNGMDSGIRFVACSAAFDIAGIKEEDLIDGVKIGGVATFIDESKDADIIVTF